MPSNSEPRDELGEETGLPGFGRRRPRLSDEETAARMLQTAADALIREGVTVSLDHIRLEDVIREAGVSRSTVYRRWPHKDEFLGDLVLHLARANTPMTATGARAATELIRGVVLGHRDWLESGEGRQRLATELLREIAWQDFRQDIAKSNQWRTYLALIVTFVSLPEGTLHDQVQDALRSSEEGFARRVARSHQIVAELLGLQPQEDAGVSYDAIADLAIAMMRGLVLKALTAPDLATRSVQTSLFGEQGDWTLPALGLSSVISAYLEPDPEVEWDQARIRSVCAQLEATDNLFPQAE